MRLGDLAVQAYYGPSTKYEGAGIARDGRRVKVVHRSRHRKVSYNILKYSMLIAM
jgi:hypothetical protein